jgi:regulator of sirC expression with transglutaminase-like and TPR domain
MGFVQLDRNKFPSALGYFKRALNVSNHPAALFGMAEAYRYAGEPARALETYRRFIAAAPDDRDAPLARRQIRLLAGDVPSASSILQEGAAR